MSSYLTAWLGKWDYLYVANEKKNHTQDLSDFSKWVDGRILAKVCLTAKEMLSFLHLL